MALVLAGLASYGLVYTDESGVTRRVNVKRGQDVSVLGLPDDVVAQLKSMTVRGASRRVVPVFVEMGEAPGSEGRHTQGGKVSNVNFKQQAAEKKAEEEAIAIEPAVEAPAEPAVEAPAEAAPEEPKKAPAKKSAPKKKASTKKSASKKSE